MTGRLSGDILFLSSYPPRECGIATFTSDLIAHLRTARPDHDYPVAAIDRPNGPMNGNAGYGSEVRFHLAEQDAASYLLLADAVAQDDRIAAVCIQHEFGLFGGRYGAYLIPFVRALRKPVAIAMHTVLPHPIPELRRTVRALSAAAHRLIAMTDASAALLVRDYGLSRAKIEVIPHGIPDVPFILPEGAKKRFDLEGRFVCTTFGLLGPGKGIEFVLEALPALVKRHPELVYVIAGATHPVVKREQGEAYRELLQARVEELGLKNHVRFLGRFLSQEELIALLQASDVYVSPGLDPNQAVSGTLSYALGAGRPVVSTAFAYAKAVLSPKTGRIVPFRNVSAFTTVLRELLDDQPGRERMAQHAYAHARSMAWPNVSAAYGALFDRLLAEPEPRNVFFSKLPAINLAHLRHMTDAFGMLQFSKGAEPDPASGYTLDDNARALIVAVMHHARSGSPDVLRLARTYLKFLGFVQHADGFFSNCVSIDRRIQHEEAGNTSEDAHGRALWALGITAAQPTLPNDLRSSARALFSKAVRHADRFRFPRSIAFALIGVAQFLKTENDPQLRGLVQRLSHRLLAFLQDHREPGWEWFEDEMTYGNAKLSEALLCAYQVTKEQALLDAGLQSLDFLLSVTTRDGVFVPIGQDGWYRKGAECALHDQQPIEAGYTVQALLLAAELTGQERYLTLAQDVFAWFLGRNTGHRALYDDVTGGCRDGLMPSGTNENQGAESVSCYLMARLAFLEHPIGV